MYLYFYIFKSKVNVLGNFSSMSKYHLDLHILNIFQNTFVKVTDWIMKNSKHNDFL